MEEDEEKIKGCNGWPEKDQVEKEKGRERGERVSLCHCHGRRRRRLRPINQKMKNQKAL